MKVILDHPQAFHLYNEAFALLPFRLQRLPWEMRVAISLCKNFQ